MTPKWRHDVSILVAIMATIGTPIVVVLLSVPLRDRLPTTLSPPAGRFGYTISLLLFAVPTAVLMTWYFGVRRLAFERAAFWRTALFGFGTAAVLDVAFANAFFEFRNADATLGVLLPGWVAGTGLRYTIPVEEFLFYALGFTTILLTYIWGNEYWFAAYRANEPHAGNEGGRLARLDRSALLVVIGLIALAFAYKKFGPHPYHRGIPGYFIYLALSAGLASLTFFPLAREWINWRALSLTLFVLLFLSLLWEVSLGVPQSWWDYRDEQMLGIRIRAWDNLPFEAVIVWVAAVWGTIIVYEVVRAYLRRNVRARRAFLGIGDDRPRSRNKARVSS